MRAFTILTASVVLLLTGCFGGESAETLNARREAEGKAVGSACRHAMRAIEDCYTMNAKTMKSAVFAGWREMDEYMRENKLEGVTPTLPRPAPGAKEAAADAKGEADKAGEKGKGKAKSAKGAKADASAAAKEGAQTAEAGGQAAKPE